MDISELSNRCKSVIENPTYEDLVKIFKVWSCCPNLSALNAAMVYEQLGRTPRHLKSKQEWLDMGIKIRRGSQPIKVWVPKMVQNPKTRVIERKGMELQERYDITQTTAKYHHPSLEAITIMLIRHYGIKLLNDPKIERNDIKFEEANGEKLIIFNKDLYKEACLKSPEAQAELLKAALRLIYGSREANVLTDLVTNKYLGCFPGYTSIYLHFNNVIDKDFLDLIKKDYNALNNRIIKLQIHYGKKSQLQIEDNPFIPTQKERDIAILDFLQRTAMDSSDPKVAQEASSLIQQFYINPNIELDLDKDNELDDVVPDI